MSHNALGKKTKGEAVVLNLVERQPHIVLACRLANKQTEATNELFKDLLIAISLPLLHPIMALCLVFYLS